MDILFAILCVFFLLSLAANYVLIWELKKAKKSPPPQQTVEATQILHDLTISGAAIVKVTRLDPNNFIVRSPRDRS